MAEGPPTLSQHFDQMLQSQAKMFSEILAKIDNLHCSRHGSPSSAPTSSIPNQIPTFHASYSTPTLPLVQPPSSFISKPNPSTLSTSAAIDFSSITNAAQSKPILSTPKSQQTQPQFSAPPPSNQLSSITLSPKKSEPKALVVSPPQTKILFPLSNPHHLPPPPILNKAITVYPNSAIHLNPMPPLKASHETSDTSSPGNSPPNPSAEPSSPNRLLGSDMWSFPWDRAKEWSKFVEEFRSFGDYDIELMFGFCIVVKQRIWWHEEDDEESSPTDFYKEYAIGDGLWYIGNFTCSIGFNLIFKLFREFGEMLSEIHIGWSFGACELQVLFSNTHMKIGPNNFRELGLKIYLVNKALKMFDKMFIKHVNSNVYVSFEGAFNDLTEGTSSVYKNYRNQDLIVEYFDAFGGDTNDELIFFDLPLDEVVKMDIGNGIVILIVVKEWLKLPWPPP